MRRRQAMKVVALRSTHVKLRQPPDQDRIQVLAPDLLGSDEPLPVYRVAPARATVAWSLPRRASGFRRDRSGAGIADGRGQGHCRAGRWLIRKHRVSAITSKPPAPIGSADSAGALTDPDTSRWMVRPDGATSTTHTATVTSRAVVNAVRDAALYYREHQAEIFALPAA